MSPEAIELIKEAVKDKGGQILRIPQDWGYLIMTNGKKFTSETDGARELAFMEGALEDLIRGGYVREEIAGNVYKVTREGYNFAEK